MHYAFFSAVAFAKPTMAAWTAFKDLRNALVFDYAQSSKFLTSEVDKTLISRN